MKQFDWSKQLYGQKKNIKEVKWRNDNNEFRLDVREWEKQKIRRSKEGGNPA